MCEHGEFWEFWGWKKRNSLKYIFQIFLFEWNEMNLLNWIIILFFYLFYFDCWMNEDSSVRMIHWRLKCENDSVEDSLEQVRMNDSVNENSLEREWFSEGVHESVQVFMNEFEEGNLCVCVYEWIWEGKMSDF